MLSSTTPLSSNRNAPKRSATRALKVPFLASTSAATRRPGASSQASANARTVRRSTSGSPPSTGISRPTRGYESFTIRWYQTPRGVLPSRASDGCPADENAATSPHEVGSNWAGPGGGGPRDRRRLGAVARFGPAVSPNESRFGRRDGRVLRRQHHLGTSPARGRRLPAPTGPSPRHPRHQRRDLGRHH